ncbi:MAG: pre-rRNA-processing protein pno1 [Chaenotheca gracillima]|nr:MAG: pre-rRNA-processing protein pno1 [Chaenotheca gracillima]
MLGEPAESSSKPPPTKRSLFTKPSWSKVSAGSTNDEVDIFSRSKGSFAAIAKEQEEKLKRREAKKERERIREREAVKEREGKRRRLLDDSEDENEDGDEQGQRTKGLAGGKSSKTSEKASGYIVDLEDESDAEEVSQPISTRDRSRGAQATSKTQDPTSTFLHKSPSEPPILLSDNEDVQPVPRPTKEDFERADEDIESDEELAALARHARERAKLKQSQAENRHTSTPDVVSPGIGLNDRSPAISQHQPQIPLSPDPEDAKVELLITSLIEGSKPLIVHRRLHQRLKDVRLAWCARQGFEEEETKTVFLTWRGKRLFDVTTCKGLGIEVDADGDLLVRGKKDPRADGRKIHMEAMTDIIYEARKRMRETHGSPSGDLEASDRSPEVAPAPPAEKQIKLVIRSKAYDEFRLIVKPSTKISRIIEAFCKAKPIEDGREVSLHFDGDKLDPGDQVGDTELDDLDHIDASVA